MGRRAILTGVVLAAVLAGTSDRGGAAMSLARTLRVGKCELRVVKVSPGIGSPTFGSAANYLVIRFVNDGRGCTIGSRSRVTLTATSHGHVVIKTTLTGRKLRVAPRQRATMTLGAWWVNSAAPTCRVAQLSAVVLHSSRASMTVSFPRRPFNVCTPLQGSDLLISRN